MYLALLKSKNVNINYLETIGFGNKIKELLNDISTTFNIKQSMIKRKHEKNTYIVEFPIKNKTAKLIFKKIKQSPDKIRIQYFKPFVERLKFPVKILVNKQQKTIIKTKEELIEDFFNSDEYISLFYLNMIVFNTKLKTNKINFIHNEKGLIFEINKKKIIMIKQQKIEDQKIKEIERMIKELQTIRITDELTKGEMLQYILPEIKDRILKDFGFNFIIKNNEIHVYRNGILIRKYV